jgi:hypothetical protein
LYESSSEVGGVLELLHVSVSKSLLVLALQTFFVEGLVVGVIVVHPDDEYLSDILFTPDCVVAEEGKGSVFNEVTSNHWLHYHVQDHQLLHVLNKGLLGCDLLSA